MKGKRLRAAALVVSGSLIPLCGCALYGNDRSDTRYVYSGEADGKVVFTAWRARITILSI